MRTWSCPAIENADRLLAELRAKAPMLLELARQFGSRGQIRYFDALARQE